MKDWNTSTPYPLSHKLLHAVLGVSVSLGLFYTVSLSLKKDTAPSEENTSFISQAVQLTPPEPPEVEQPAEELDNTISAQVDFSLIPDKLSIQLLASNIRPTRAQDIVQKVDFDLSKFEVKGRDINDMVVYEGKEVDKRPEHIYRVMPDLKLKKAKEVVQLIYVVNTDGTVGDTYVLETTNPEFNEEVIECIKTWTYSPAEKNGQKVRCWVKQKIIINKASSLFGI